MAIYRIYTLASSGRVVAASQVSRDTDERVFAVAREILMEDEMAEIWDGVRYVGAVSLESSTAGAEPQFQLKRTARQS